MNPGLECFTHVTSTRYRRGGSNAYLHYTVRSCGKPINNLRFYTHQTNLAPEPGGMEGLASLVGTQNQEPGLELHLTACASSDCTTKYRRQGVASVEAKQPLV